jgi:hypothetical protein
MRSWATTFLMLYLLGCAAAQPTQLDGSIKYKHVFILYDQPIWSWPGKNSTEIIVPGIYLPLQKKAFQLDRAMQWDPRVLHLVFDVNDDSSTIQILANRFSYKNWLYADTIVKPKVLPEFCNCFRLHITTYKTKNHGFIPVLGLQAIDCLGTERFLKARSNWLYHIPRNLMSGSDPSIYVKKGYSHLFRRPLIPASPIIKVTELIAEGN